MDAFAAFIGVCGDAGVPESAEFALGGVVDRWSTHCIPPGA